MSIKSNYFNFFVVLTLINIGNDTPTALAGFIDREDAKIFLEAILRRHEHDTNPHKGDAAPVWEVITATEWENNIAEEEEKEKFLSLSDEEKEKYCEQFNDEEKKRNPIIRSSGW